MFVESWKSNVEKEMGTEALQHEAAWGEILRVVCRDLCSILSTVKVNSSVEPIPAGAIPALGVVCGV